MRTSQNTKRRKEKKTKEKTFQRYMQEKLAITVLVITLALFALVMILYNLVKHNTGEYKQIVLSQQSYDSRVIPYRRGDIVDRNGTYLATSQRVYNLIVDPKQIMADEENYLEPTITALAGYFEYDAMELRTLIQEKKEVAYVRYARKLSLDQKEGFEALVKETNEANRKADSQHRIKGVWFESEYQRIYPYNSLACNVLGFSFSEGQMGSGGIEQYYNDTLIGNNGREYGYLNDESNLERVIKPATNGNTVVSTIDVNIQSIIERNIEEWQKELGGKITAVVAMNPNNGEVLAMASSNKFNLNDPRNLDKYTEEDLLALGKEEAVHDYKRRNKGTTPITIEEVEEHYSKEEIISLGSQVAWNKNWRNFCVSDTYEPGSPSKIFTVAAALEEGVISGNETYVCDGAQDVGGWTIKCSNRFGHGPLTVTESLMVSCNDAMMQIAAQMGKEKFGKYQEIFGFGSKTGIDLPGEADTKHLIYRSEDLKPSDLATNSFGQNYNCTMIQMAAAYCSVINGGSYYEPHVVKQILNEQGAVIKKIEPKLVRQTVSSSTSEFIKDALFKTVNEKKGTGKAAAVVGYDIAGKTGTAEKYPRSEKNYLVSFAGFAPADDPQVFLYVVVDTPNLPPGEQQARSSFASGVFQKIMKEMLPYINVFPSGEAEAAEPGEPGVNPTQAESSPSETGNPAESTASKETGASESSSGQPAESRETQPEGTTGQETIPMEESLSPPEPTSEGETEAELPGEPAGNGETQEETIPANPAGFPFG